jgi:hypothetical protein
MTRLAFPDPAYVAEVMHALPDKVDRLELDPKLMTTLDLEPEPASMVPGAHTLQMSA